MRIAVIDDEKYSRLALVRLIRQSLPQAEIAEAASGAEALQLVEKSTFDMLFIDIHLGDMEGTTVASLARRLMPETKIIFATAFSEYAVEAFDLRADDYILKPFDPERVHKAIARCLGEKEHPAPSAAPVRRIAVNTNRSTTLLGIEDITYIETDGTGRGCVLHTLSGKAYSDSTTLTEYEAKLSRESFYRIHKTCLVQLHYVETIFPWSSNSFALHVRGTDAVLPISRDQHWRLEFQLQAGWFWTKHDPYQYTCPVEGIDDNRYYYKWTGPSSLFKKRQYHFTWLGPTRIGVTLSYDILYRKKVKVNK